MLEFGHVANGGVIQVKNRMANRVDPDEIWLAKSHLI